MQNRIRFLIYVAGMITGMLVMWLTPEPQTQDVVVTPEGMAIHYRAGTAWVEHPMTVTLYEGAFVTEIVAFNRYTNDEFEVEEEVYDFPDPCELESVVCEGEPGWTAP